MKVVQPVINEQEQPPSTSLVPFNLIATVLVPTNPSILIEPFEPLQ